MIFPNEMIIEQYVFSDEKYALNKIYAIPDGSEDDDKLPIQIIISAQFPEMTIELSDIFENSFEVKY